MRTNIIRSVIAVLGAVFFIFGIVPLIVYKHVNVGNIALILFGALTIATALLWNVMKGSKPLVYTRNAVASLLAVCFLAALIISCVMVYYGYIRKAEDGKQGTIVVLGCQIHGESPSLMLAARLNAALEYAQNNDDVKIIVSGGQGHDEIVSEAYVMKKYLTEHGIDAQRIYMEEESTDTKENIEFSAKIVRDNNLSDRLYIATDGFHQLRAAMHVKDSGCTSYSLPAKAYLWLMPEYWVREILGVLHYLVLE